MHGQHSEEEVSHIVAAALTAQHKEHVRELTHLRRQALDVLARRARGEPPVAERHVLLSGPMGSGKSAAAALLRHDLADERAAVPRPVLLR